MALRIVKEAKEDKELSVIKIQAKKLKINLVSEILEAETGDVSHPVPDSLQELTQKMRRALFCSSSDYRTFDVTLVVTDSPDHNQIHTHKAILCARSEYFKAMFLGSMKESTKDKVEMPDLSYLSLLTMVEYCYTDTVKYKYDIALEILVVSKLYILPHLTQLLIGEIVEAITHENVLLLFKQLQKLDFPQLEYYCIWYINRYYYELSLNKLPKNLLCKVQLERDDPNKLWPTKEQFQRYAEVQRKYDELVQEQHQNNKKEKDRNCSIQ